MTKKGLGRGLGALIPEVEVHEPERANIREIEISSIEANPRQPRKSFDPDRLAELADSIREHGVVQPIVVQQRGKKYEIVAGERRWRASQLAGLIKIPALIRTFSDAEVMEIALIENLQRQELNPLEEAEAFRVLIDEFRLTQDELAKRLGKSRPQISNTLRLLQLSAVAREELKSGRLSMGHAKVLLGVEDGLLQGRLAQQAVVQGLSVRQVEALVQRAGDAMGATSTKAVEKPTLGPDLRKLEERLQEHFGTPVKLIPGAEKGRIEITYFGEEGLGRVIDALGLGGAVLEPAPRVPFSV
jgi:ParB family chromosome partitioning protein